MNTHDERTLENYQRENEKLRQDLFNAEQENKALWDVIRRHEENQKYLIAEMEKLNALEKIQTTNQ